MLRVAILLLLAIAARSQERSTVEILRDRWGIPHVYAATEAEGFYGVGYAAAEDRLLQMELFRRRARGRLAELFGERYLDSDRRFRIAGIGRHCDDAAAALPDDIRGYLSGYAAGVNAWVRANPEGVAKRFAPLGIAPEPWNEGDNICAWMGMAEIFDRFIDEGAVQSYREFRQLAGEIGEEEALSRRGMMIDDAAAVVPESEMAKNGELYARLRALPQTPGFLRRSLPDEMLRFSHAWAVDGTRTVTGAPLLESDPQTSVNNPPLWYEFHLSAGRYDVRGIGVAGCPGMLIGFNRYIAWGASALGAGSLATFVERLSPDGRGYLWRGQALRFERREEIIQVKESAPVVQEVLRTRHGFVFNPLTSLSQPGEVYVSHYAPVEDRRSSVLGMLQMMGSNSWEQFREAMDSYYSPGLHVVYADWAGNIGYQTLVRVPRTKRTIRMALEGWTGDDEVMGRIPLDEMPHMLNPDSHFISHANNLPVGSWYPHDLGISTGGTGHSARSQRLMELLRGNGLFSVDSFESAVHRDDVHSAVMALLPAAQRVAAEAGDRSLADLLTRLRNWDFRYRSDQAPYPAAMALSDSLLLPFRRSPLGARLGGGEGGILHLARLLTAQFAGTDAVPTDPDVRDYLLAWLRGAAAGLQTSGRLRAVHPMPYQQNGPLQLPALDPVLDLVSPTLSCTQVSTIWSQPGNSYTQIVDLADIDNSRTILPPGISEDPDSPFHTNQAQLWVEGRTHPAPLSRPRIEENAVSRTVLRVPQAWLR